MFRAKTVPKWLLSRNIGKRIVMNQHNGLATQGLIERGKGAMRSGSRWLLAKGASDHDLRPSQRR